MTYFNHLNRLSLALIEAKEEVLKMRSDLKNCSPELFMDVHYRYIKSLQKYYLLDEQYNDLSDLIDSHAVNLFDIVKID